MTGDIGNAEILASIRLFHERCMSQTTLEALPDAIAIYLADGVQIADNALYRQFWKLPKDTSLVGKINLFTASGVHPDDLQLMRRAIAGEHVTSDVHRVDLGELETVTEAQQNELWMQTLYVPLRVDDAVRFVMIMFRDRTEDVLKQARISESEARVLEQQVTIEALQFAQDKIRRQQDTISELSTPIIEVWPGVLTMPLVGHIDERRAGEMTERLLANLVSRQARSVIVDLTGVEQFDAATANHIVQLLRAVPLLGVEPIITGIHANVAQSIIALGLDLHSIRILGSLRGALAEILTNRDIANASQSASKVNANRRTRKNGE